MAMKRLVDTAQIGVGPAVTGEVGALRLPEGRPELEPAVRLRRFHAAQVPVTVQGVLPQGQLDVRRVVPCQCKEDNGSFTPSLYCLSNVIR